MKTEYETQLDTTPPSGAESGEYKADVYGFDFTLIPVHRMYLTGLFTYRDSRSHALDNENPSVIPYEGDVFTAIGTLGYAIDKKSDLTVQYLYSRADNYVDISEEGYPFGNDKRRRRILTTWKRRISNNMETRIQYGYYYYDEDSNSGVNDYQAHLVSAGWILQF